MFRKELEKFVNDVSRKIFRVDPSGLLIENYVNPGDVTEGLSKYPIFFVKNSEGELIFLVKAFIQSQDKSQLLIGFLVGSDFIAALPLKESRAAVALAFNSYEKNQEKVTLVAIQPAAGFSLNEHIRQLAQTPYGTTLRVNKFDQLLCGIEKAGKALAELNHLRIKPSPGISPYFEARDEHWFQDYQQLNPRQQQIQKTFETLALDVKHHHPSPVGYIHGDAHPGNLFYDKEKEVLTLTDFDRLIYSIDEHQVPRGPVAFEFVFASLSFLLAGRLHGLAEEESRKIEECFQQAYWEKIPALDPQTLKYYRCLFWMRRLYLIATAAPDLSPKMQQQLKIIQETAKSSLEKDLS